MPRNKYHDTPVVEFHEAFGAPVRWSPGIPPRDRRELRIQLILEELTELITASGFTFSGSITISETHTPDIVAVADALTDLRYVIDGATLEFGLPAEKLLREVHRSNMSKLGEDGKPILREDGKILKGPRFVPPMLAEIIELYSGIDNG